MMIHLGKILVRILPWDPWLPRCSKNLARSCQDSQDASKRVNPGGYIDLFINQTTTLQSGLLIIVLQYNISSETIYCWRKSGPPQ